MRLFLVLVFLLLASNSDAQFKADSLTFLFGFNEDQPLNAESSILLQLKDIEELSLFAYTDTVGTADFNLKLAKRRAATVSQLLPSSCRISTFYVHGETAQFGSDENNRRVDLKFKRPVEGKLVREVLNLNIKFVGNQAVILPKSYPLVNELIAKIKTNTYTKIELHGHVCCSPDLSLSQRRALAIQSVLIENGVDEAIIESYGHSNFLPLVPEYNEDDQETNRRVEVVLIKSEQKY